MRMMIWPPIGEFSVQKPTEWPSVDTLYRTDPEKKRLYGLALATGAKPFEAALKVFDDTNKALWVSQNWANDPIVLEAKAIEPVNNEKLLDKEQLASKFLLIFNEKDPSGRFYANEAKDRIAALKVYAEICGYIGKVEIDASNKTYRN